MSLCDFEQLENPEFLDMKEKAHKFLYANGQGFGAVLDSAVNILGKIFVFIGLIAILSTLNIFIVLLFIGLVLLNSLVESKIRNNWVKWDMEKAPIERKTSYFVNMIEDFTYGKEIRMYNFKNALISKVSKHLDKSNDFYTRQIKTYRKNDYFHSFTSFIRDGVSYGYLIYQIIFKTLTIGDFTMYLAAISQFSGAMNDVMQSFLNIKQFGAYYDELEKYLNIPAKMREGKSLAVPENNYAIEFKNVNFKYAGQNHYALQDVNIKIKSGEKLSIVGENGAGKTTFVKLLTRLYDPTNGVILLNGVDIRDIDYEQYQSIMSAVFQDFKLFSFTLKENVALGAAETSDDKDIESCLIRSGFSEKLGKLDKGIHTNIYKNFEPDGFEPSGGEGQKIALARALYKNAAIVILDEPTAALDPRAEYEIYQHFNELVEGKTAIYISHRLSSARFCDTIAVFKSGGIVEYGSHDSLIEKDGIYAELFNMQAQFYV
jgi:ABC-type multidrug transport system fused ATPase/permease subunit